MKILALGGTRFVGRHIVEAARAAGHEVSVFSRGETPLPWDDVEHLRGDRGTGDLESLRERTWDACIDVSAYLPQAAREAAELLAGNVGHYVFISTASVYAVDPAGGMDEATPAAPHSERRDGHRLARAVRRAQGRVRAGGRARLPGPHADHPPGHRRRAVRSDEPLHLVGRADRARRRGARARRAGLAGATRRRTRSRARSPSRRPSASRPGPTTCAAPPSSFGEMIDACRTGTGTSPEITWVSEQFLLEHGAEPFTEFRSGCPTDTGAPRLLFDVERARPRAGPRAAAPRRHGARHLGMAAGRALRRATRADRGRIRGTWTLSGTRGRAARSPPFLLMYTNPIDKLGWEYGNG